MDRNDFERLLEPCLEVAYRYAYKLTGNQDDAVDLVQDATVQAYKSRETFEMGTNFKAWFMKVLTNKFYKSKMRQNRNPSSVSLDEAEDFFLFQELANSNTQDTVSEVFNKLDQEEIQKAINVLPEEFRVVCLLYFLNDFSYEEIASVVEIPIGTVRSRLHRGRKLLQQQLWQIAKERGILEHDSVTGGYL